MTNISDALFLLLNTGTLTSSHPAKCEMTAFQRDSRRISGVPFSVTEFEI